MYAMQNLSIPTPDENLVLVTIDGENSLDLDDGISLESVPMGTRLVVVIADPTVQVPAGSNADLKARERAATIYRRDFPVSRMLSTPISENEGSLVAGKPRAMFVHDIVLSSEFDVLSYAVRRKTLTIAHRLSHADVRTIVSDKESPIHAMMGMAAQLGMGLLSKRRQKGALALYDLSRMLLANEEGQIVKLSRAEEVIGHIVVQETMVLANTLQAKYMAENDIPAIYRNHVPRKATPPLADMVATLEAWMRSGNLDVEEARAQFQALCGKASYAAVAQGHFALSVPAYLHGTSPLRRYPDLFNAQQLGAHLDGTDLPHTQEEAASIATGVNEILAKREEERSQSFKDAVVRAAEKALVTEDLAKLEDNEIGQAIKMHLHDRPFPATLEAEVIKRIDASTLGEKNLGRFLRNFPSDALGLVAAYERLLARTPERNITFLELAKAAEIIDSYSTSAESSSAGFVGKAEAVKSGKQIQGSGAGTSKKEAIQRAANQVLRQMLGLEPLPQDAGAPAIAKTAWTTSENFKGALLEMCQARKWSVPVFTSRGSGPSHAPTFSCAVTLDARGEFFEASIDNAATKKEAEARCSELLLGKLRTKPKQAPVEVALPLPKAPLAPAPGPTGNPVGALQEWLQKAKRPAPVYDFSPARGGFSSTLTFDTGKAQFKFEGWATTKAEAKKIAAFQAMAQQEQWSPK